MMNEIQISLVPMMLQAALDGRKTRMRWLVDPQPEDGTDSPYHIGAGNAGANELDGGVMEQRSDFAGDLVIFVENYVQQDGRCIEINSPDDYFWMDQGWAVGDNNRGRYCSRRQEKKMRKFKNFDLAVDYVFERRKKRPRETFFLVYILGNAWARVSTLDEILTIDAKAEEVMTKRTPNEFKKHFEILAKHTASNAVAVRAAQFLSVVQSKGLAAAKAAFLPATAARYMKLLETAGLLDK